MPSAVLNQEWLNQNSMRAYPLADDSTRTDVTGTFTLPDDFLVSLYLPIPFSEAINPDGFFVRVVSALSTGYIVGVAYDDGSADPPIVASAIIPRDTHTENMGYALGGMGNFDSTTGKVAIGLLDGIDAQPAGRWSFSYAGGKLDPDCIRPAIRGVTALFVVNGQERSAPIYNEVELAAGTNMRLDIIPGGVVFNAIDGAGLTAECACVDSTASPITSINGVKAGPDGDIAFAGNDCLAIAAFEHGILVTDKCSQPYCGCAELEALTQELEHLGSEAATLRNAIGRMNGLQQQFNGIILGSRAGSGVCLEC